MSNPIDLLKVNSFNMQFSNQKSLELMVTSVNLPGFTLGQMNFGRPVVKDKRPGDSLEYNDLNITILCDEQLKAFEEIYHYLILSANPNTGSLEINDNIFQSTLMLTTNKNNVQRKVKFYNCFFTSIGDLQFESTTTDAEQITFQATLAYSFYDFD